MTWQPHAMTLLLSTVLVQKTHLYLQVQHQLLSQLLSQLQYQLQLQHQLRKKVIFKSDRISSSLDHEPLTTRPFIITFLKHTRLLQIRRIVHH